MKKDMLWGFTGGLGNILIPDKRIVSHLSTQTVNFNLTWAFSLRPGSCKGTISKGTCHTTIFSRAYCLYSTIPCTRFDPRARHGPMVRESCFLQSLYSPSKKATFAIAQEIGCLEGILIGGSLSKKGLQTNYFNERLRIVSASLYEPTFQVGVCTW